MAECMSSSRPLTVAIPRSFDTSGPFCARRPNLSEILANTAPPPWTLSAFMAYLSQNHCLETLEFTMDASRYRKHFNKLAGRYPDLHDPSATEDCQYVKMLWHRLMDAYIASNGHREVNLPSEVRDRLLSLAPPSRPESLPPHPSALEPAVDKVYELMSESVLVPFLNSMCPPSALADAPREFACEEGRTVAGSYDERAAHLRHYGHRSSPPLMTSNSYHPGPQFNRASAPSSYTSFTRPFVNMTNRGLTPLSTTSTSTSSGAFISQHTSDTSMDDASADSHTSSGSPDDEQGMMTPPTTPPSCQWGATSPTAAYVGGPDVGMETVIASGVSVSSRGSSPRSSRSEGTWKKVSRSLGFKRRSKEDEEPQ